MFTMLRICLQCTRSRWCSFVDMLKKLFHHHRPHRPAFPQRFHWQSTPIILRKTSENPRRMNCPVLPQLYHRSRRRWTFLRRSTPIRVHLPMNIYPWNIRVCCGSSIQRFARHLLWYPIYSVPKNLSSNNFLGRNCLTILLTNSTSIYLNWSICIYIFHPYRLLSMIILPAGQWNSERRFFSCALS